MLYLRKFIYSLVVFTVLVLLSIFPENLFSLEKIRLLHADKLENVTRDGVQFKKLTGNILIERGGATLRSEKAYYLDKNKKMEFLNDVEAVDEKNHLTCDSLIFLNETDLLIATGKPVLESDTSVLKAKEIRYNLKTKVASAAVGINFFSGGKTITGDSAVYETQRKQVWILGNASMTDSTQNTTLKAQRIRYDLENKLLLAVDSPVFTKRDSSDSVLFVVNADTIMGDENRNVFSGYGNVNILRDEMKAVCKRVEYSETDSSAWLYQEPVIYYKEQTLKGKEILLEFSGGRLSRLFITEDAYATSAITAYDRIMPEDSLKLAKKEVFDWLSGKSLEIFFRAGDIDSMVLGTMASSDYNVLDDDSVHQGLNSTSGDSIFMSFDNRELTLIKVKGGCQGKFIPSSNNVEVDTVIAYRAEEIEYWLKRQISRLVKLAEVEYGDAALSAGKIEVFWQDNMLFAEPLSNDSVNDSLYSDLPTLNQKGREPFSGVWMAYNMKTRKGKIKEGRTKLEDGYYQGKDINKQEDDVFYVKSGIYTTCDIDSAPHYYFKSNRMKLIKKDKIIARPIILYIGDIPLFGLPWGVFPDRSGKRHSGWLMPSYGENRNGGYLKGFGYYFAPGDYWDAKILFDFYDKVGTVSRYDFRYALRYYLRGGISGSYVYDFLTLRPNRRWNVNINHHQTLSSSSSLNINGSFVSDERYLREIGISRQTRLQQQMVSNATYSKNWPGTPFSISANVKQIQNLQTERLISEIPESAGKQVQHITRTLPSVRFTMRRIPLIPEEWVKQGKKGKWYSKIYLSGSSNFSQSQKIYYRSEEEDSSLVWKYHKDKTKSLKNSFSFSHSHSFFGWLAVNQSLSFRNDWVFRYNRPVTDSSGAVIYSGSGIMTEEINAVKGRVTGNYNLRVQTKLYGLIPVSIGPLMAVRHVVTPSVSYNLTPDFSKTIFGLDPGFFYHGYDSTGKKVKYDYFTGTTAGSTPQKLRQQINIELGNLFQIKTYRDGKESKRDLITFHSSTSYDFAADSLKLKPLSTSIRTSLTKKFVLQMSLGHDFYKYVNNRRINRWNSKWYGIPVPRMTSMSASTAFRLSGKDFSHKKTVESESDTTSIDSLLLPFQQPGSSLLSNQQGFKAERGQLWSANLSLRYSLRGEDPLNRKESFYLTTSLNLKITKNWKIGYSSRFDLLQKRLESQDFSIYRDLHCWELSFNWTPSGYGRQYMLTINVKSPNLRDLKYEERGGRMSGPGIW